MYVFSGFLTKANGRTNQFVGTCTSRDPFFAKRGGNLLPMHEVDEENILKAAYTNFVSNAVSRSYGLRNLTWDQLKNYGILREKATKVEYGKTTKSGKWTKEQAEKAGRLREWMLAEADGDPKVAAKALEEATAFEDKETGKRVKGKTSIKNLTGKQVDFLFKQNKSAIDNFEGTDNESAGESE